MPANQYGSLPLITQMNIPEFELRRIVAEYIDLVKWNRRIQIDGNSPFDFLVEFLNHMIPLFAKESGDVESNLPEFFKFSDEVQDNQDTERQIHPVRRPLSIIRGIRASAHNRHTIHAIFRQRSHPDSTD